MVTIEEIIRAQLARDLEYQREVAYLDSDGKVKPAANFLKHLAQISNRKSSK